LLPSAEELEAVSALSQVLELSNWLLADVRS
jgi:hypothetical protein